MNIREITPVLFLDAIEPVLAFWQERLHYEEVLRVPHRNAVGFVLLSSGQSRVMLQTRASLADDLPTVAKEKPTSVLYVDVDSLSAAEEAMKGVEVIVPVRKTFYGAMEFAVKDPGGQITIFSEHHR